MDRYQINAGHNLSNSSNSTILTAASTKDVDVPEASKTGSLEESGANIWPDWAKYVQCVSHFLLTFYSSVTFLIYYAKQKSYTTRST